MNSMRLIKKILWLGSFAVLTTQGMETNKRVELVDEPLADFQIVLLNQSFELATAIPLAPHIKDHARFQQRAAEIALELNQPTLALKYAEEIPNWRQGAALADYANYSIAQGITNQLVPLLNLAQISADSAEQEWRRDTVLLKLSKAWKSLGNTNELNKVNRVLNASEQGSAELSNAQVCAPDEFNDYVSRLNAQLAVGGLELQQTALASYTLLYKQFFDDETRRDWIEQSIISRWNKLPYLNRIDLLVTMTETAQQAGDLETAQHLADVAQAMVDESVWPTEYHVQVLAKMADLRMMCEQPELAAEELQKAVGIFSEKRAEIIDIFRTEALLPVAEAYTRLGDLSNARKIYALAVEEAVVNSNSRPRAEDLCQIGLSMAQCEVEPDAALWNRMDEIKAGLGDPW
ncbi:hypothetical protein P4C99_15120 [Pontiellaceae bacterium B1224]|nr:hypothetical protein [Pontiellaceae bacterium B1224]